MSAHAPLAPSAAQQWVNCSGSVVLAAGSPSPSNVRTVAGTASHWVGEQVLKALQLGDMEVKPEDYIGRTDPDGTVVDAEMAEGAGVWVSHCLDVCRRAGVGIAEAQIERRLYIPTISGHCFGTPDFFLVTPHKIYLSDYKFGHKEVDAERNWQMICYLQGIIDSLSINGHDAQHIKFEVSIVQPYCYQRDSDRDVWTGKLSDIRADVNKLIDAAQAAFGVPTLTSGPHCLYCPARVKCPTVRRSCYALIDYVDQPVDTDSMSLEDLEAERDLLLRGGSVLKSRTDAIEDEIKHRLEKGETCGLTLTTSQGRLNFNVSPEQAIAFCSQFGVDISKIATLTPTQALGAAPNEIKPHFREAMKTITARKTSGLKLTKRDKTITARAFKKEM